MCYTVFLYSSFSIHIGVFNGHFGHTKSNQQLILTYYYNYYSKSNPNETKNTLDELLWFKIDSRLTYKSIDIDFCPLNQLLNQSNHIEYEMQTENMKKTLSFFVEL